MNISASSFSAMQFTIGLVVILIINLLFVRDFKFNAQMGASGFFTGLCFFFLNKGFSSVANPGLGVALFRTEVIFTAIAAFFLLNNALTLEMMIYMFAVVLGVGLISLIKKDDKEQLVIGTWQWMICVSVLCMVVSNIFMKKSANLLKTSHNSMINMCCNFFIPATIVATILQYIDLKKLGIVVNDDNKHLETRDYIYLIVTGIVELIYVAVLSYAIKYAFNPGAAKAIISTSAIIIALIGSFIFKDATLDAYNWVGCILIIIGVFFISLLNNKGRFFS